MSESRIPLSRVANAKVTRDRIESVCLRTYSLEVIKKTCYRYASRHFSKLRVTEDKAAASITFNFPSTVSPAQEQQIIDSFHQDLLDQELRELVFKKTEVIRNLIFANAFANTALVKDDD